MSKFRKYTSCVVCLSIFIQQWILHWVCMAIESLLASGCIYLLKKIGKRSSYDPSYSQIEGKKNSLVFMFYLPHYNVYFFSDSLHYYNANFMEILLFHLKYRGLFLVSEEMYCFMYIRTWQVSVTPNRIRSNCKWKGDFLLYFLFSKKKKKKRVVIDNDRILQQT